MKMKDNKKLAESFLNWFIAKNSLIYGNAVEFWWEEEGKKCFFKWAKEKGLEFTDDDYDKTVKFVKNPST